MRGFVSITKAARVAAARLLLVSMVVVLFSIVRHDTSPNASSPNRTTGLAENVIWAVGSSVWN